MAPLGEQSPTGVFEGMRREAGDRDMGGAGRGGAVNGLMGIASRILADPGTVTSAVLLERNMNRKRLRSWVPEALRAPRDRRSRMERTMRQQAQEQM
jgi:hypothetical protein